MPTADRTSNIEPRAPTKSRRGGKRPGAGAPRGNMNGLASGKHSRRVRALQLVPRSAELMRGIDAAGSGKRAHFAQALHYVADLILMDKIQSMDFDENAAEQIRTS